MESFNQSLFLFLNAPAHPQPWLLQLAMLLAEYLIWLVPIGLVAGWLRATEPTRRWLLVATVSGLVGLACNQAIGLVWQHPRPFMIGLGHTFLAHAPDSSFPSDHLTLWWSVTGVVLFARRFRSLGAALVLMGLPIAWARIYLGVHFPLDMAGAAVVACLSVTVTQATAHWFVPSLYRTALAIHRVLFHRLIQRGWVMD